MAIADEFKGLPMEALILAPLKAAIEADGFACEKTIQFVREVCLSKRDDGSYVANMVEFQMNELVEQEDGTVKNRTSSMQMPLITILEPPMLRVQDVDISFSMEVKTQAIDKSSTKAEASISGKAGFGWWSVKISGSVSHQREHTRSTDKSAKYDIKVKAAPAKPSEGFSRLMDIFAQNVGATKRGAVAEAPAPQPTGETN